MIARGSLFPVLLATTLAVAGSDCGNNSSAPTSPTTSPTTETFTGQFSPGGGASRVFTSAGTGAVTLTVTQVTAAEVGLGVGIPQPSNIGCYLSETIEAATASTLTTGVEAGTYCVRIYDLGTLTAPVAFTLTIVHP
jgi:hypothetical protein